MCGLLLSQGSVSLEQVLPHLSPGVKAMQDIDAKRVAFDPRSEKVLCLQEDLALLLSRLGRTDESRPMWRHLLSERLHFAPTRATKGRNAQVTVA